MCHYDVEDSNNTRFGPMRNVSIWSSDDSREGQVGNEQTMPWYNSDGVFSYDGDADDTGDVTFDFYVNSTIELSPADFTFESSNPWLVGSHYGSYNVSKVKSVGDTQTFSLVVHPVNLAVGSTTIDVFAGGR